jgi:hypothetical protein
MARLLIAACFVTLLVAAPAGGKGFAYRLCGASGCKPAPESAGLAGLSGMRALAPPARPGAYFELRAYSRERRELGRWAYVPAAHALWRRFGTSGSAGVTWTRLDPDEDAAWRDTVRGLEPFRAPTVRAATLAGKPVADPASYLAVYEASPRVMSFSGDPIQLVLISKRPSPWTGLDASADFYPRQGVLVTAGTILVLRPALAERLRERRSLRVTS